MSSRSRRLQRTLFDHKNGDSGDGPDQDDDTVIVQPDSSTSTIFEGVKVKLCFSVEFGHHSDDTFNSGLRFRTSSTPPC